MECRLCLSEPVAVNLVCLKAIIFNEPQQLLWGAARATVAREHNPPDAKEARVVERNR